MLSGIGPAAELDKYGIAQVLELPEVGKNLHDHFGVSQRYDCFPLAQMPIPFKHILTF